VTGERGKHREGQDSREGIGRPCGGGAGVVRGVSDIGVIQVVIEVRRPQHLRVVGDVQRAHYQGLTPVPISAQP